MKKIVIVLALCIFLGSSIIVQSDDDLFIPRFTENDCQCPEINKNVSSASYQRNMFGAEFKNSNPSTFTSPSIKHEVWYYGDESYTSNKFISYLDPTIGVMNLGYHKERVSGFISEGKDFEIIQDTIQDIYASYIWKDDSEKYNGRRSFIIYDEYLCRMTAEYFESESEILQDMNFLEQCIRDVVYEKHKDYLPKQEITFTNTITLNEHPLPYLDITLISDGKEYQTATDVNGTFSISCDQSEKNSYTLVLSFSYLRDNQRFFQLHYQHEPDPVAILLSLNNDEITKVTFDVGGSIGSFAEENDLDTLSNITLQDFIDIWPEVLDYAGLYLHFSEVVSFYVDYIGESLEFQLPVEVYTCIKGGPRYLYEDGKSWISIDSDRLLFETEYRPKSREYHEFSHYIMHALYEGSFPESPSSLGKDINHGGYNNPTTADSYVEGFAEFMSVVIGEYYNNYWENLKEKRSGGASSCPPFGSLEPNYKAWEMNGKAEEWAVAGVLWDLYDGPEQIQKDKEFLQRAYRYIAEISVFKQYDVNNDNILQQNEQIAYLMISEYDWGDVESVYSLELYEISNLISDLFVGIRNNADDPLSSSQYDHFRNKVKFETYDKNNDAVISNEEWDLFMEQQFNFTDSEVDYYKQNLMYAYDKNNDYSMNESELVRLLAGEEIRNQWNNTYDNNGYENFTIEELVLMADEFKDAMKQTSSIMKDLFNLLPDSWDIDSVSDRINKTSYIDDDSIDLSFEEMWPILKTFHNDFSSVYDSFIKEFPDQKEGIDEIFKNHGFFADIKPENNQWDKGEEIGRAANASTSEREQRRSSEPFPGSYLKVDNQIPFYHIQILLFNDSNSIIDPLMSYAVYARNENGMVFIPSPPENYRANILIQAEGVETINPLIITSTQFHSNYENSIEQGYITSYNFKTKGKIPTYTNRFFSDVDDNTDTGQNRQQTPGFHTIELFFSLTLIALFFLYSKKIKN